MQDSLLTVDDVARLIKVPKKSVYQLIAAGKLRAIRLGRRLRFNPSDISADIKNLADTGNGQ